MDKIISIFMLVLLLSSCNEEKHKGGEVQASNSVSTYTQQLKNAIMLSGDEEAYRNLKLYYMDTENPEDIFFYSLVMANKYGNKQAFFDVYFMISLRTFPKECVIDSLSANMAIKYLIIASQKGHKQSKDIVDKYNIVYDEQKNYNQIVKLRNI